MQSDDSYRQKLAQLAASVRAWSGFVADVARVETAEDGSILRFAMQPTAPRACPCEVALDSRTRALDLGVGGETYEGIELPSLDVVLKLLQAVSDGRVVTRHYSSTATGLPLGTTTRITLDDGTLLEAGQIAPEGAECRPKHYLPYRKPG